MPRTDNTMSGDTSIRTQVPGGRRRKREASMTGTAQAFLDRIVAGTFDDHPAVGLGPDVGVVGEGLVAGALVADDTVVHLTAFAEPVPHRADSSRDESPGRRYATYRQRRDSLRNRYGR